MAMGWTESTERKVTDKNGGKYSASEWFTISRVEFRPSRGDGISRCHLKILSGITRETK